LEALAAGGLRFGGFADDEGKHPTRWANLHTKLGALLFRWPSLSIEENLIAAVPDDKLESFIADPSGEKTGVRLRILADRVGITEKDFAALKAKAGAGLRTLIVEAALGTVQAGKENEKNEYKAHAGRWFKSVDGGRELADKLFSLALWPKFKSQLLPFCNAVRTATGLSEIADLLG
jgi:putative ATP-dependent endonuclease of OLD family